MKDDKAEIGTETRNPDGNSQSGVTAGRVAIIRDNAKPKRKWKEISAEIDVVGSAVKERKNIWHKSGKARTGSETSSWKFEEEDEARSFIEEMQRNLDVAQNKSYEAEQKQNSISFVEIHRSF